jgi:hypothetical protein
MESEEVLAEHFFEIDPLVGDSVGRGGHVLGRGQRVETGGGLGHVGFPHSRYWGVTEV